MAISNIGVNHFAVSVRNLEESIEWYERVLGFEPIVTNEIPGIDVKVAHMSAPGFVLELFDAKNALPLPEERKFPNTDLHTHGNKHFSLTIADRDVTKKQLGELGVPVVMTADVWGTYGIFIQDPTGNLIELFEGDMNSKKKM